MALQAWIYPVSEAITGSTTISQTDNKITNAMTDLTAWLNGTDAYTNTGFIHEGNTQLTANQATFDASLITWQGEVDDAISTISSTYYTQTAVDNLLSGKLGTSAKAADSSLLDGNTLAQVQAGVVAGGGTHWVSKEAPDGTQSTWTSSSEITIGDIWWDSSKTMVHLTFAVSMVGSVQPSIQMGVGPRLSDTGNSYILASTGIVWFAPSGTSTTSVFPMICSVEFTVAELEAIGSAGNLALKFRDPALSANLDSNSWKCLQVSTVSF